MSNGFVVKYEDLLNLSQEYKKELDDFKNAVDITSNKIADIINNGSFTGATADSIKFYLSDVHLTLLASMKSLAQLMEDQAGLYKVSYYSVDGSTNFVLNEEAINSYRSNLDTQLGTVLDRKEIVDGAINSIHDLIAFSKPGIRGITSAHNGVNSEMNTLKDNVSALESTTVQALNESVNVYLEYLKKNVDLIKGNTYKMADYTPNSFFTNKDVYTLVNISEYFYKQHEENAEAFDSIWEAEEQLAEAAKERETQGVWKTIGGVVLIGVGGACIFFTAGAATPAVAYAGLAIGGGTAVFGIADTHEGYHEVVYGKAGDIDTKSVNFLRDSFIFKGDQENYQMWENIFAFSASAMIPIGKASAAHALTFRSGSVAVGKLAISNAAGQGASKITMDLTDNRLASMFVGMGASMLTGYGLNAIDNRFAISGTPEQRIAKFQREMKKLPHAQVDESTKDLILSTDKGSRISPEVYLDGDEIKSHLGMFDDGSVKIESSERYASDLTKYGPTIGDPKTGTFVMPKNIAEEAIRAANGDPRVLEQLLSLEPGSLGDSPVMISFDKPSNIRMPSGNEAGAGAGYWIPGGYTGGGIPEAVIDQAMPGSYSVTNIFGK